MQHEFQLTPKSWQYIKKVMDLYKDSVPFDKVTLSQLTDTDLDEVAKLKSEKLTEAKMRKTYDKHVNSAKESLLRKLFIQNEKQIEILDAISIATKKHTPLEFDRIKIPLIKNNNTKSVVISDAHL
jgi:hypothetical protein